MSNSDWLVIMTKPRMENEAKEHLARQGIDVYLPLWTELKCRSNVWEKIRSPMFSRYLFARPTYAEQSLSPIRSTRGVSRLVHFGSKPAWASEKLVNEIRKFEALQQDQENQLKPFKKGDQVIILDGPFKGISAEVFSSSQQRVILLLQIMGNSQQLQFKSEVCQSL